MSISKVLACCAVAFSVALAVVVGNRMSAEAMAVVIGIICGIAAGIPTSMLIVALGRRSRPAPAEDPGSRLGMPLLVVAPPPLVRQAPVWADYGQAFQAPPVPAPREYRIIGEEPM